MSLLLLFKPSTSKPPKLRPLGFNQRGPRTESLDDSATLTGANAPALSGNITADVAGDKQFTALGFTQQERTFDVKGVGESQVELVGAQANAQGEELEGVSVFITLGGAEASADAGVTGIKKQQGRPSPSVTTKKGKRPRYIIEVDGEFVEVSSPYAAEDIFNKIREAAKEAAEQSTEPTKVIPKVSVKLSNGKETKSKRIAKSVEEIQAEINEIYRAANDRIRVDQEIAQLLNIKLQQEQLQDEEDVLMTILLD